MRTVTFSDKEVSRALADSAVCAWVNRIDGFHNCEPSTEEWIFKSSGDAYTTRNICTFFMTPDLQVVHYVSGYYSPAVYLAEIDFAARLRDACFDRDFKPREDAEKRFKECHESRANELRAVAKKLKDVGDPRQKRGGLDVADGFSYDGEKHAHDKSCAATLAAAFEYIASVNDDFAKGGKGSGQDHAVTIAGAPKAATAKPSPMNAVWIDASRTDRPKPEAKVAPKPKETRAYEWLPGLSEVETDYLYGNPFAEETTERKVSRPKTKAVETK